MKRGRPGTPGFVGQRLRSARDERGLSVLALAEMVGVTRQAISQYETGAQSPRPEVMEGLSKALNLKPNFFLRPFTYEPTPLFFRSLASTTKGARTRASERHKWLAELTAYIEQYVELPPVAIPTRTGASWTALAPTDIDELAAGVRQSWGLGNGAISNVMLLLENHGVVVSSTSMWSETLDAFSGWLNNRPFIVLEGNTASAVRTRMNLAHELAHLVLHRDVPETVLKDKKAFDQIEAQAWRFAGAFMLPADVFRSDVRLPTLETFRLLKPKWKVSIQAMVQRARDLGMISQDATQAMWRSLSRRGWRSAEPLDDELHPERPSILRDAFTLVVESRVLTPVQITDDTALSESDLRDLAGLDIDFFAPPSQRVRLLPLQARQQLDSAKEVGNQVIPFPSSRRFAKDATDV